MKLRALCLCVVVFVSRSAHADQTASIVWTLLEVNTHIDNAGEVHVRETHHVSLSGPVKTIAHRIGRDTLQTAAVTSLVRLGPDGTRVPRTIGDPSVNGQYSFHSGIAEWSIADADGTVVAETIYEVEYDLANALSPAWTLGPGPMPLDARDTILDPRERWKQAWPRWREAWPLLRRAYRFDHDVLFPSRDRTSDNLERLDYHMKYDEAWRLVTPEEEWAKATEDVDYRVTATFEFVVPGKPSAVNPRDAAIRTASLVGLPIAGLLFLLGSSFLAQRLGSSTPIDRTWMQEHLLAVPPEVVAAESGIASPAVNAEDVLTRMAAERKLRIQILRQETEDETAQVEMRLLASRESLSPVERALVDALFFGSNVTSSDAVKQHYRGQDFDPDEVVDAAVEKSGERRPPRRRSFEWHPIGTPLAVLLSISGVLLLVFDLTAFQQPPIALFGTLIAGALIGAVAPGSRAIVRSPRRDLLLLVPLVLLVAAITFIHLCTNASFTPYASAGMALVTLGRYQSILNGAHPRFGSGEQGARARDFARARAFATNELEKSQPALEDAWMRHLEALGLEPAIAKWRAKRAAGTAPSSLSGGDLPSSPFTGTSPASAPLPEDWSAGFSVFEEDGEEEGEDAESGA